MQAPGRFQFDLFILMAFVLMVSLVPAAFFTVRQAKLSRETRSLQELSWFLFACIGFLFTNSFEILTRGEGTTLFFSALSYVFIAAVPTWWFLFALSYGGYDRLLKKVRRFMWVVPPLVFLLLLTNPIHRLHWKDWTFLTVGNYTFVRALSYGPSFWAVWFYLQALVVSGTAIMLFSNFKDSKSLNPQSFFISFGALIPILVNGVFVLRIVPGFHKDFTSISFSVAALVLTFGVFYQRLFDLAPIARRFLVEALSDPLLALDAAGRVVDANPAARSVCGLGEDSIGRPFSANAFLSEVSALLGPAPDGPVEASPDGGRWFEIRAQYVSAGSRTLRLLAMRDVTDRRQLIEKLSAALADIQSLEGIIPICASCKKIRDDSGYWQQVENYVSSHTRAQFSHGICPDCRTKLYPDLEDDREPGQY